MGVHVLLIYCAKYRCNDSVAISGDAWPDVVAPPLLEFWDHTLFTLARMIGCSVDNVEPAMRTNWRIKAAALVLFFAVAAVPSSTANAKPISAEVARKCKILRAKQFPPRQIGNPAAGSAYGSGQDQREFFRKCVANGGKMESTPEEK